MSKLFLNTSIETVTYSCEDYDSMGNERPIPEISGYGKNIDIEIKVEGRDLCTVKIGDFKFMEQQLVDLLKEMKAVKEANKALLDSFKA